MKNITHRLMIMLLASSMLICCGTNATDREQVDRIAQEFITAFLDADLEECNKYCIGQARQYNDVMIEGMKNAPQIREQFVASCKAQKLLSHQITIDANQTNASVSITLEGKDNSNDTMTLDLIKQGDQWKIENLRE